MGSNKYGHDKGLHIVIINQFNYRVLFSQVFETHIKSDSFDQFISNGIPIPFGYIVAAASKGDCITNMSSKGKNWFK